MAERPLAQHCEQLLPPPLPERDLLGDVGILARELAVLLGEGMGAFAHGGALRIGCGDAGQISTTAFINKAAKQTAHCVIDLPECGSLLFSIEHRSALLLTDRAYGGLGEVPEILPDDLPLSADLTLKQMERSWCEALGRVFPGGAAAQVARRGRDLGRLDPFRGQGECIHLEMTVEQDDHEPWTLKLSASLPDMHRTTGRHRDIGASAQPPRRSNDPLAEPFGGIELSARAVLARMTLSLARASALKPGDIVPLAIAREVPLQIGPETIAHGAVGAQDDRVALQITRSFA